MKVSTSILLVTLVLLVTGLFASNLLLKKEYDKVDKSDLYWTFGKILQQPFKHLKIEGGNVTNIAFEPNKSASVRVSKNWDGYEKGLVKAVVKNDTLFVKFPNTYKDEFEKRFLDWNTMVRIFSPELLSVQGINTNLGLYKFKQKSINVRLSGKSKFKIESYLYDIDSFNISQRDSSRAVLEMSPELSTLTLAELESPLTKEKAATITQELNPSNIVVEPVVKRKGWETMRVKSVVANLEGVSLLDVGHAQIQSLKHNISDSSAIVLSGGTLKSLRY